MLQKPKIIIDGRTIASSSGRYVRDLVNHLARLKEPDFEPEYTLLLRPQDIDEYRSQIPEKVTIRPARFADFSWQEQIRFYFYLKRLQPDLVHFCFPQHPVLYRGRFVVTIHDLTMFRFGPPGLVGWFKKKLFKQVLIRAARYSRAVITVSNFSRNQIAEFCRIKPEKINLTYLAAGQLKAKAKLPGQLKGQKFYLTVNNGSRHKNNLNLARAHQKLLKDRPDLKLVIIGRPGPGTRAASAYPGVIVLGQVPESVLAAGYERAQLVVQASLSEGFGLTGLEAWSYQKPVVASDRSCLPEIYGPGALYFNPEQPQAIAAAINRVLNQVKVRHRLIKAGRRRLQQFDWDRTARNTAAVYKKALQK